MQNFNKYKNIGIIIFLVLITACKGTIDSDLILEDEFGNNNIYRRYRVNYDENSNKIETTASFHVETALGTTVRLVNPSSLEINGLPALQDDNLTAEQRRRLLVGLFFPPAWLLLGSNETSYHNTLYGIQEVAFEFTDQTGTYFYDNIRLRPCMLDLPSSASIMGFMIRVRSGYSNSSLSVQLIQDGESKTFQANGNNLYITSTDLLPFRPGRVEVKVAVRTRETLPSDDLSRGGSIHTSYTFAKRNLFLNF